jgi:hypothetical protein
MRNHALLMTRPGRFTLSQCGRFIHKLPELLSKAALIGIAAAVLLAAWGIFVRQNVVAEELEPQALHEAKAEDKKVET